MSCGLDVEDETGRFIHVTKQPKHLLVSLIINLIIRPSEGISCSELGPIRWNRDFGFENTVPCPGHLLLLFR